MPEMIVINVSLGPSPGLVGTPLASHHRFADIGVADRLPIEASQARLRGQQPSVTGPEIGIAGQRALQHVIPALPCRRLGEGKYGAQRRRSRSSKAPQLFDQRLRISQGRQATAEPT